LGGDTGAEHALDLVVVAAAHCAVGVDERGNGQGAADWDQGLLLQPPKDLLEGGLVVEISVRAPRVSSCVMTEEEVGVMVGLLIAVK
jgi:hypothetical protein